MIPSVRRPVSLLLLSLAAAASLATSSPDVDEVETVGMDATYLQPAFTLDEASPTRAFVVTARVEEAPFASGLTEIEPTVDATLAYADPRGAGATVQVSSGRADVDAHGPLQVARFGVAPGETRQEGLVLDPTTFVEPCDETCGAQDAWTLRFEHLGGGPVRVTWAVRALYDTGDPAEARPIQITATDLTAEQDAP